MSDKVKEFYQREMGNGFILGLVLFKLCIRKSSTVTWYS